MGKQMPAKQAKKKLYRSAIAESFIKLDPRVMIKNPVMFVVEIGFVLTLLLSFFPDLFGSQGAGNERFFNFVICIILFITVLFGNFAEAIAEGRGKAQAESLRKSKTELTANRRKKDGTYEQIPASVLRKGDIVRVQAGQMIPVDGEVQEGLGSVDESAITGESAPVIRGAGG
ncbi:hypothetical protein SIN01_17840 [Sporolactobacillus inulinus]|nr:hypothetical protein SIN01_17840 [Sporolactobacillus inulinus]